jgi:ankyrin repeat protein
VDPDRRHAGGWPPIVWASYRGHVKMVRFLLRREASVTPRHGNPIHYAGQRGHREICSS